MCENKSWSILSIKWLFLALISVLGFLCLVMPNSFHAATAIILVLCFLVSFPVVIKNEASRLLLFLIFFSWIITAIYMLVGVVNGAPNEAVIQVLIVYIVSPVLWVFVLSSLFYYVDEDSLVGAFKVYVFLALASVALFFFLFNSFGPNAVSVFRESANVNLNDGYSGATMHVYGSLMFFAGAFFAAPDIVKGNLAKLGLLGGLFVAAVTSGRSAFLLAVPLGLVVCFISRGSVFKFSKPGVRGFLIILIGCTIFSLFLFLLYGIDLGLILSLFFEEIADGGGAERSRQSLELINGIELTSGLGVGHGIGVDYIRSYQFPWRYEMVWLATIYRVGFLGAFVYFLPFLVCFYVFIRLWFNGKVSAIDRFFFGGFVCAFLASTTNPYVEAFAFQWMYVAPVVYFLSRVERSTIAKISPT